MHSKHPPKYHILTAIPVTKDTVRYPETIEPIKVWMKVFICLITVFVVGLIALGC